MKPNAAPPPDLNDSTSEKTDKRTVFRDAVVFQIKLAVDGVIDIAMVPVSLVSALLSLLRGDDTFYRAIRAGRSFDRRVNLWGVADTPTPDSDDPIDAIARRVDAEIRKEVDSGRLQDTARDITTKISRRIAELNQSRSTDRGKDIRDD